MRGSALPQLVGPGLADRGSELVRLFKPQQAFFRRESETAADQSDVVRIGVGVVLCRQAADFDCVIQGVSVYRGS